MFFRSFAGLFFESRLDLAFRSVRFSPLILSLFIKIAAGFRGHLRPAWNDLAGTQIRTVYTGETLDKWAGEEISYTRTRRRGAHTHTQTVDGHAYGGSPT